METSDSNRVGLVSSYSTEEVLVELGLKRRQFRLNEERLSEMPAILFCPLMDQSKEEIIL